jgi:hypothetical protein
VCVHVYACVHVCASVCMCVRVCQCVSMYVSAKSTVASVCPRPFFAITASTWGNVHKSEWNVCVFLCVCLCVCVCVCVCACVHACS